MPGGYGGAPGSGAWGGTSTGPDDPGATPENPGAPCHDGVAPAAPGTSGRAGSSGPGRSAGSVPLMSGA